MKKLLPALLLMLGSWAMLAPGTAQAAPGDTTRVTIWNQRKITHYGNFDTTAVLPAARPYRKVLMHYILGRYACAPGSQYCGSWDYTTRVILRPPAHDTLELARIITPYATDWLARNLTHDYVVDVTDYAPLLHDSRSFRYEYQGYSWGFNVTVRLEFIEGTPPRNPVDVRNLYFGGWAFGNATDPINNHLPLKRLLAPAGDSVLTLKNIISGHGSDNSNCAEFCRKSYALLVNGQPELQQALWRDDCGRNQVYPQTGTWIYDRANWCPGNYVKPLLHPLNRYVQPGMAFNMKLEMPAYTNTGSASFNWTTQLVTAAGINFATDAALDEIISPNLDDNYLRQNPSCGGPVVRLRNLGRTVLTAATINYQVLGRGTPATFAWTGNLPFGADTLLTLPPLPTLLNATGGEFRAWVSAPNGGAADPNPANDGLTVRFAPTLALPARPVIAFTTNGTNTVSFNETTWELLDAAGNVVAARRNTRSRTTYSDTLSLAPGCYALHLTDTGCDGFAWWANPTAGNGSFRINNARTGAVLRTVSGDFGCEYTLNFRVQGTATGTTPEAAVGALDLYPNPSADGHFELDLNLPVRQQAELRVLDALGRTAYARSLGLVQATRQPLDLHRLTPGLYTLEVAPANGPRLHQQLMIGQ